MKKLYFLLLFFTSIIHAQIVNIPDANFKDFLLHHSVYEVDTNHDEQIQLSEAQAITHMFFHVYNLYDIENVSDMTGIEAFTNLRVLDCNNNQLTSLNLSSLTQLEELYCGNNNLSSLNVTGLTNLKLIMANNNQLSNIDLSTLTAIEQVNLEYNLFTSLTITNPSMRAIMCHNNQLTNLNITGLLNLVQLNCSDNLLTSLDLTGCLNLVMVECYNNLFTALDFSNQSALQYLYCYENQLTLLNLNGATQLIEVDCSNNLLPSINHSGLPVLKTLKCEHNALQGLNLSGLTALDTLFCGHNALTALDFSSQQALTFLNCSYNQFASLNILPLTSLQVLICTNNQLTTMAFNPESSLYQIDFSDNLVTTLDLSHTLIVSVNIGNNPNLTYINIKNGVHYAYVIAPNCPNLVGICADEFNINNLKNNIPSLANVEINSYCSFVPGGHFNTITGIMRFDADNNGCDANDVLQPNLKVTIDDGIMQGATFVNAPGLYTFHTQAGNFLLTPTMENPTWFNFSPPTATIPFADNNNNTTTQNFCITPDGFHPDIEVIIAPIDSARPGFDATYQITFKNKGNYTYSEGIVGFQFDDTVLDFVSASENPLTQAVGQINWNFTNLLPFESRSIQVTLNVNGPMETPPVNINDLLNFTASSFPSEVDETPIDNTFTYQQTVVGSFDPNDKTCLEGNIINPENIGNYLHYSINFENTGTAAAEKIVVKDVIDATKFDISTLQILSTSHPATTKITGNKVEFMFDNINLAPTFHGNVVFKIKTKNSLTVGSAVSNKAEIYFDYNFPIETNTATSTFQTLSNVGFETDDSVRVFPNPTMNRINITASELIKTIQLFDAQGRLMSTSLVNDLKSTFDVSSYSKGIYFLKVQTAKGIKTEKIIKE